VDEEELIMITQQGLIIRLRISSIKVTGRNTMGVRLINLSEGDKLVDVARIVPGEEEENGDQQELVATETVEGSAQPRRALPAPAMDEDEIESGSDFPDDFDEGGGNGDEDEL